MSSVNSKSTSGQDDAIRQARDEYRKKEAELVKKHAQEIRKLNESYANEISRKDKVHSQQISSIRERSTESMTERDAKYKREIDDLRKMHHKQLEKLMQDNQAKINSQRRTSDLEVKQANLGKEDRTRDLHERYNRQAAELADRYSEQLDEYRDVQRKALNERETALRERQQKELELLRDERNETVAQLKSDLKNLREHSNEKVRSQEVRHHHDKMRMNDRFMDTLIEERQEHNDIQRVNREGFHDSIEDLKKKFTSKELDERGRRDRLYNEFKSDVDERVNNQVNSLKRQLGHAKKQASRADGNARLKAQREIANVRDSYQANIDGLERERQELLKQNNEINARDIRKIRTETDKHVMENSRYYLDRMSVENFKNKQAIENMKKDYQTREEFQKEFADERVNKIHQASITKEESLKDNYQDNIEILKAGYEDEKREIRLAANKEKVDAVQVMKEQVQKSEAEQVRKINDLVAKYEKRIQDLNDSAVRERRLREAREKQLVRDLRRQNDAEKEALKIQYEEKNRQTQAAHEREMRDVTRRQNERLDEVLRAGKKT